MEEAPMLRFVFLTLPTKMEPTLNLMAGEEFSRYRVTREQLLYINEQIVDALIRGKIGKQPGDQEIIGSLQRVKWDNNHGPGG